MEATSDTWLLCKGSVEDRCKFVIDLVGSGQRYAIDISDGLLTLVPLREGLRTAVCPEDLTSYIFAQRIFTPREIWDPLQ